MKRYYAIAMTFFFSVLLSLQPVSAAGGWTLIKNSSGIKVYERAVPGTELMEYMGVTTIDVKMEVIGEALRDLSRYNQWLADCFGAQVEKQFSRNDMVIYMVLKPPIIQERDIVLKDRTVYDYENGKASIAFQATDEIKIPLEKNRVRVTVMSGYFDMDYLGRNRTKFIYRLKVDPGGDIPKKMAYAVMRSYPYDSLKGLKKIAGDAKYVNLARGSDEEKQINARAVSEAAVSKILANRLVKFVKDRASIAAILAADRDGMKTIAASGGSYAEIEKVTTRAFIAYMEKIIKDKTKSEKLKVDQDLIDTITDMVTTDCGATETTVDDIVAKYMKK